PREKQSEPAQAESSQRDARASSLPAGLERGQTPRVLEAKALPKVTRPPPPLNDATLLTAMETAGKTVDEKDLSEAMKDSGLGTPATRANIIETLIARGDGALPEFLRQIEAYVTEVVGRVPRTLPPLSGGSGSGGKPPGPDVPVRSAPAARAPAARAPAARAPAARATAPRATAPARPSAAPRSTPVAAASSGANERTPQPPPAARLPITAAREPRAASVTGTELSTLLRERFGFDSFRPHQQ